METARAFPVPVNRTWGVDLTGKTDFCGDTHAILGVIDHGSRRVLTLTALKDKSSIFLPRRLLDAIERFGMPRSVRTDNEAVFTSRLFAFGLRWLGIGHQRSDPSYPWMNGALNGCSGQVEAKRRWSI